MRGHQNCRLRPKFTPKSGGRLPAKEPASSSRSRSIRAKPVGEIESFTNRLYFTVGV